MKKQELQDLIQEVADLSSEHYYISFKAPQLLEKMQQVKRVPKDLKDEYEAALNDIKYIENSL